MLTLRIVSLLSLTLASASVVAQVPQALSSSAVPIPPGERALPMIMADQPIVVQGATKDLEGPVFLPDGTLLFSDVQGGRVMRLDRSGRIASLVKLAGLMPGGMALGPDRRLYIAAANSSGGGAVVSMALDGSDQRVIVPVAAGFSPNDLVFDHAGGFYFTDARGGIGAPEGGVWYVKGDAKPLPVLQHLPVANGIALSPDDKTLWVGGFALGQLHRLNLTNATTTAPFGATTAYHFTGSAPDSMRADAAGRVYVSLYGQGRILVFTPTGLPLAQIVLPGRDAGRNLNLTSLALRSGSSDIAIVTSDGRPGGNATIFHARMPN